MLSVWYRESSHCLCCQKEEVLRVIFSSFISDDIAIRLVTKCKFSSANILCPNAYCDKNVLLVGCSYFVLMSGDMCENGHTHGAIR